MTCTERIQLTDIVRLLPVKRKASSRAGLSTLTSFAGPLLLLLQLVGFPFDIALVEDDGRTSSSQPDGGGG